MLPTEQIYQVVVGEIASMDHRMEKLIMRYEALPEKAFENSHGHGRYHGEAKSKAVTEFKQSAAGDPSRREQLIEATHFYHINSGEEKLLDFATGVDSLVDKDVKKAALQAKLAEQPDSPGSRFTGLLGKLKGGIKPEIAEQSLERDMHVLAREREIVRNLGRVLKVALEPEQAGYNFEGTAAARIDRLDVTEQDIRGKDWVKVSETAWKSLGPRALDEHVVDYKNSDQRYSHSIGFAKMMFGTNQYGESDDPKFGVYERHAYSTLITLHPSEAAAEKEYRTITDASQEKVLQVRHTRAGNFVGGAIADHAAHPVTGKPGAALDDAQLWRKQPFKTIADAARSY